MISTSDNLLPGLKGHGLFPSNRPAIFSFDNLSDNGRARVAVGQAIKKQKLLLPGGRWSTFVGSEYLIAFGGG